MSKFHRILVLIFLMFSYRCEDFLTTIVSLEPDTTPPIISISYPLTNSVVSGIVNILCVSTDNEGVEKVELWVNESPTGAIDESYPYSLDWDTTLLENGNYTILVRSYDTSNNQADSAPIDLIINNSRSNI